MEQQNVHIRKSVRVFTIGKANAQVKHIWICLHGYGQLADWFGKRFERWASKERLFVFPEGPHRFYINGTSGRVGASWMTKEDRLNDIEDQYHYLEGLMAEYLPLVSKKVKIHVMGFSQGVATALRWIDQSEIPVSSLICWAGTFPPDIDYKLQADKFKDVCFNACFGDEDEFISLAQAKKLVKQLEDQKIDLQSHFYKGGHRLQLQLLEKLIIESEKGLK